jgi:hypothetical protein
LLLQEYMVVVAAAAGGAGAPRWCLDCWGDISLLLLPILFPIEEPSRTATPPPSTNPLFLLRSGLYKGPPPFLDSMRGGATVLPRASEKPCLAPPTPFFERGNMLRGGPFKAALQLISGTCGEECGIIWCSAPTGQ